METTFCKFIRNQGPFKKPLLLGLSGGSDSTLLYHLLKRFKIAFESAHINHGWRQESDQEACSLRQLCAQDRVTFHETKLSFSMDERNIEDHARQSRQAFFKDLCERRELEGVMLGHHADDLAETVLKRLFEGARLSHLHGPMPMNTLNGIPYFRPLLGVRKKEILAYLEAKKFAYFIDKTNFDVKFLRAKFRKEIFPYLSEAFGKEITSSLCRISKNSIELQEFLEELLAPYRLSTRREEDASSLNLAMCPFKTQFEWKAVVRDFFEREQMTLTTPTLEAIVAHLRKKSSEKVMLVGTKKIKIDRGNLILFCKNPYPQDVNSCLLKKNEQSGMINH